MQAICLHSPAFFHYSSSASCSASIPSKIVSSIIRKHSSGFFNISFPQKRMTVQPRKSSSLLTSSSRSMFLAIFLPRNALEYSYLRNKRKTTTSLPEKHPRRSARRLSRYARDHRTVGFDGQTHVRRDRRNPSRSSFRSDSLPCFLRNSRLW